MRITATQKRLELIRDGFCVFRNVLKQEMLIKLERMSTWMIAQEETDHFDRFRSQGSLIPYCKYPHQDFANLIAYPKAIETLAELGFEHPRVGSGYVISKPPHSPGLFWHQDGHLWGHPIGYTEKPQQYFLMYYLVDTNRHNGCLRVLPGSHLKRHALHNLQRVAHQDDGVSRGTEINHPAFSVAEGEIDVPVRAGDLVIGDARMLHATHPNCGNAHRTVITIWYWPAFDDLPPEVKAFVVDSRSGSEISVWREGTKHKTDWLEPVYDGISSSIVSVRSPDGRLS